MKLRSIAHARSGDKGNATNVGFIVFRPEEMTRMVKTLTKEKIKQALHGYTIDGIDIQRYDELGIINVVIKGILNGGVTQNTNLDRHGRAVGDILLEMEVVE